jgi:DNA-binding MarR family transcriptional regulator
VSVVPDAPLTTAPSSAIGSVLGARPSSPALLLALLGHVAMRRLRDVHIAHGLSPRQFHLLGLLHEYGPTGQSELGTMTGTDPSILVTMLNPLEADRLICRERDEHDRRRHLVTLTAAGETKLVAAAQAQREAEDELFAALDDEQREQLLVLLTMLQDGLVGSYGSPCSADAARDHSLPFAASYLPKSDDRSPT